MKGASSGQPPTRPGATRSIDYPKTLQSAQSGDTLQQQWQEQAEQDKPQQNLRFQGQYFDSESGLHYTRFRNYDPDCGRFIIQDLIRLRGSANFYYYAPNPVTWTDPWGLTPIAHRRNGNTLCSREKFPSGSGQSKKLGSFVDRWNQQIKNNGGNMTRHVLSSQEQRDSDEWRRKTRCQCPTGKVAGHIPDAAAGSPAVPLDWMAQFPATNGYIAGIVRNLPVGYTYDNARVVANLTSC